MKALRNAALVTLAVFSFSFTQTSSLQHRSTVTVVVPYTGITLMNECNGQTITFSGNMLLVLSSGANGSSYRTSMVAKPQDLSFTDASGEVFKAVGVTVQRTAGFTDGSRTVFPGVNNIIFQGNNGTRYVLNESARVVYNSDGSVESYHAHRDIRCPE